MRYHPLQDDISCQSPNDDDPLHQQSEKALLLKRIIVVPSVKLILEEKMVEFHVNVLDKLLLLGDINGDNGENLSV
jgi:hypothetical protein